MGFQVSLTNTTFSAGSSSISSAIDEMEVDETGDKMEVVESKTADLWSPINALPSEILHKILHYAAGSGQPGDIRNLSVIRSVCKDWHALADGALFSLYWSRLGMSQLPQIQNPVKEIDREHPIGEDNAGQIPFFDRFVHLTQNLRENGARIPSNRPMIGILSSTYEQKLLDPALEAIWGQIRQQINFNGAPVPENAAAIRAWLNDPSNAPLINQITYLKLPCLKLRVLPPEIGLFTQLTELSLAENQLTALPESIGNLTKLRRLCLDKNRLTTLPESFGKLTKLTSLELCRNQMTTLPESIGNLTELTRLSLHDNKLKALPESFGNLTKLIKLTLFNNELTALPESFGNLTKLTELEFSGNRLKALPESFGNLTKLTFLGFRGNQLTVLPESFGKLTKLTELCLDTNQLKALPKSFGSLTQLTWLSLYGNQLTALPESFGNLDKEIELLLDDNLFMFRLHLSLSPKKQENSDYPTLNATLEKSDACTNYVCRTPLAALCQGIHNQEPLEELLGKFEDLTDEMKQRINGHQKALGSCIDEDPCVSKLLFIKSVMAALREKSSELSNEQKKLVHYHIWDLAGQPIDSANWGEEHAEDNIIRLIDAMELATSVTAST